MAPGGGGIAGLLVRVNGGSLTKAASSPEPAVSSNNSSPRVAAQDTRSAGSLTAVQASAIASAAAAVAAAAAAATGMSPRSDGASPRSSSKGDGSSSGSKKVRLRGLLKCVVPAVRGEADDSYDPWLIPAGSPGASTSGGGAGAGSSQGGGLAVTPSGASNGKLPQLVSPKADSSSAQGLVAQR